MGVSLSSEQAAGIEMGARLAKERRFRTGLFFGPAGCGKTTALEELRKELNNQVRWVSPTGRGAKRLRELKCEATTMHRLLYAVVEDEEGNIHFVKKSRTELDKELDGFKLLAVDESSMMGPDLWDDVSSTCQEFNLPLLLVGDGEQLSPVMPPGMPRFSCFAEGFPIHEKVGLTKVFRQEEGTILDVATRVRMAGADWQTVEEAMRKLPSVPNMARACVQAGGGGALIAHTNATRMRLNVDFRTMLRPGTGPDSVVGDGEPLLVRRNFARADVYNGDIVPCQWVRRPNVDGMGIIRVNGVRCWVHEPSMRVHTPQDNQIREYRGQQILRVELGYALTCHAAQGSEWDAVYLAMERSLDKMDVTERRRWVYTALTRAKTSAFVRW